MSITPTFLGKIQSYSSDALFDYFIQKVKKNSHPKVSYILNQYFKDSVSRANFGNRQDVDGNSAYHHAAHLGHYEIIVILNGNQKFKANEKFILFTLLNNAKQRPLDLSCLAGRLDACFFEVWKRASEKTHNPMGSLKSACQGKNPEIVKLFLQHEKFDKEKERDIIQAAIEGTYGEVIKDLFSRSFHPNANVIRALSTNNSALLNATAFAEYIDFYRPDAGGNIILDYLLEDSADEYPVAYNLQLLLKAGCDLLAVNENRREPLLRILRKILTYNWHNVFGLILDALIQNNQLDFLLQKEILYKICKYGDLKSLGIFAEKCEKLHIGIANLAEQVYGETPLWVFAQRANVSIGLAFFDYGLDVNICDVTGATPAHFAVESNNITFMKGLLTWSEVNLKAIDDCGNSCLHEVAIMGSKEMADLILESQKVDINLRNCSGDTPLLRLVKMIQVKIRLNMACRELLKILRSFIDHGARLDITNHAGESIQSIASSTPTIATILRSHLNA